MSYITRSQWGARAPRGSRNSINARPLGTAIHWNGPSCAASIRDHSRCAGFVRGIQNFHMDVRRWSDIAYTMFVCPHGDLFEGRGKGVGTAANGTNHGNANYYAIYLMWGKGDGTPPKAMLDAAAEGVALCRSWGAGQVVTTHNALLPTECPGAEITGLVKAGRFNKTTSGPQDTPTQDTGELTMSQYEDLKKRIDAIAADVKAIKSDTTHMPKRVWSYRIDTPKSVSNDFKSVNKAYSAGGLLGYNLLDFMLKGRSDKILAALDELDKEKS